MKRADGGADIVMRHYDIRDGSTKMAEVELQAATVVTVAKDEPYPTGSPPNFALVLPNCKRAQELTTAAKWESQRVANLLAHGMIAGGAAVP